ncbi:SDR family oxidoreductase [Pseudomonas sp. NA-150]|uniref:SDR family oxidoreductase n=1 Tax=Pseudomonas sp. NA-150 TaxID=3367525 RepID=UPI0037C7B6AC
MPHTQTTSNLDTRLQGQRVVVLGGSSGIGFAVAQQALAVGAQVVIVSSNSRRLQEAIQRLGGPVKGYTLDLNDERAIEHFFGALGAFDHLVFTAGDRLRLGPLADTDLQQARKAFDLRYWAALAAAKYGARQIREGGSIVLTTGIAGLRPQHGWVLGASVCGAIESLTRALAVELAPVRVNAVSPGLIRTDLWQDMSEEQRQAMYTKASQALPVGKVGEADDVAAAYLFLMRGAFSTGQTFVIDGGAVLV